MKGYVLRPASVILLALGALATLLTIDSADRASAYVYMTVAGGGQHTCAITGTSGVKCWGRNTEGQVGDGTTARRVYATQVSGLTTGVTAIAVGGRHNCALVGGNVKCWGTNYFGEIGDGTIGTNRLTPATVCASGSGGSCLALSGVSAIGAGDQHVCAVVSGGVKCWGRNQKGQLGDGTTANSANPVQVSGLTSGAVGVVGGDRSTCALMSTGAVKCWGDNGYGQLGDGSITDSLVPVDVAGLSGVTRLSAGETQVCALLTTGNVKCWGNNDAAQLGNLTRDSSSTPVTVCAPGTDVCGSLSNVVSIASGGAHSCAMTSAPAVFCWGWDGFGQLSDRLAGFFDFVTRPTKVLGSVDGSDLGGPPSPYYVLDIGAGAAHSCVIMDPSGWIYCWGWNLEGQLGDGRTTDRATWAADTDWDGCTDEREARSTVGTETTGGRRNPFNGWDFFDTPDTTNTTLSTSIAATTVIEGNSPFTVTVASTNDFPVPGTLFVDQEKFSYSSKTATTFTLDGRMLDFTTAAQHNTGAIVMSNARDRKIDSNDVGRVQARYFTNGNPSLDPRLPPPPTGYHPAFDRVDDPNSSEPWDLIGPNGSINIADIVAINAQFTNGVGHSCQ